MKTQSNFYLFLIALISAMGGFLFGYDWVVIGGAKPFYEQYFGIAGNPVMQGWAMSSALIGCLFGALSAGKLSDRLGRKPILILAAGLFICTAVGTGAVHSFTFFNVFRLVGGFAIGIASSLSPMYIAEIAPAHLRGRFVSINQLTVVLGILTSQIVNWQIAEPVALGATHEMIRESWNGQMGWRWMFWAMTVPAALFFVFSFILPESPRWLASSGKREAALKVFTRMGGKEYAVTELAAIEAASACQTQEGGFRQLLNPAMYKVLTIGVVMAILQQWCGINVIFNYAQEIFMAAGYGVSDVLMNIVVTGITNVIFTILAMFVVDRWGRKALTLIGSFGLAIIYSFMGAAYYFHITGIVLLIIVVMAIACYAMTLATVMWVIISEIFPNRIRGVAMSVCTFALWAACFILTYTFPMLNSGLGAAGTFWLYGLICLGGGIFVVFRLPETKGKSLEEIEKKAREEDLPIFVRKTTPRLEDSFWVNVIGKGYPVPNTAFRWCTEKMKIKPTARFIIEQVDECGEAIILIGTRKAESATRARSIKKHEIHGKRLTNHTLLANTYVYAPIKELLLEEVWYIINTIPSPWGFDNKILFNIYLDASADDYECPTVVTDKSHGSCGQSRFGCWTCTVVKDDKSMRSLIKNGREWMQPLYDFRLKLDQERNIIENRFPLRRDGRKAVNDMGPYTFTYRAQLLEGLLNIQHELQQHTPEIKLISDQELIAIQVNWYRDFNFAHQVSEIYNKIYNSSLNMEEGKMKNKLEADLMREICQENIEEGELIEQLLMLQKSKSLMQRRRGLKTEIESRLEEFVNKKKS